jgi:DNA-binding NarL/FixJ family response regulator
MRLLLIDDHPLFTQSLQFLLSELDEAIHCTLADSIADALQAAGPFDLILLDLKLPGATGFAGLHTVRKVFEDTPVVLLSGEENSSIIRGAIAEGAMGFVPKSSSPQVLMAAMQLILAGGAYLPPHVLAALPRSSVQPADAEQKSFSSSFASLQPQEPRNHVSGLSQRQLEALLKAVQGKPNKVIAREMNLAEGTIKSHLSAAFRQLGVANRTEAVFRAAQLGLTMPT